MSYSSPIINNHREHHLNSKKQKAPPSRPKNVRSEFTFSNFFSRLIRNTIVTMIFLLVSLPQIKAQQDYITFSDSSKWEDKFEHNPYTWPDNNCKKMEMGKSTPDSVRIGLSYDQTYGCRGTHIQSKTHYTWQNKDFCALVKIDQAPEAMAPGIVFGLHYHEVPAYQPGPGHVESDWEIFSRNTTGLFTGNKLFTNTIKWPPINKMYSPMGHRQLSDPAWHSYPQGEQFEICIGYKNGSILFKRGSKESPTSEVYSTTHSFYPNDKDKAQIHFNIWMNSPRNPFSGTPSKGPFDPVSFSLYGLCIKEYSEEGCFFLP